MKKLTWKDYILFVVAACMAGALYYHEAVVKHDPYANFVEVAQDIRDHKVKEIVVQSEKLEVKFTTGAKRLYPKEGAESFEHLAERYKISPEMLAGIKIVNESYKGFFDLLTFLITLAIPIGAFFFLRRTGVRGMRIEQVMKCNVTFADVAGLAPAKAELTDIAACLERKDDCARYDIRLPRGILFTGEPGTGKTLLARALAGETKAAFFTVSGSQFVDTFVGSGARNVRNLFDAARAAVVKTKHPAIIFIDEIDAVGVKRTDHPLGNDQRDQTLNELLVAMDGLVSDNAIVVIAATNRPDMLDGALLRPGRFDRKIHLELPDRAARRAILEIHVREKPLASSVALDTIAARTAGFSGAQLESLVNEAAILMIRAGEIHITGRIMDEAMDKVLVGVGNARVVTGEERERVAYHEAGHAIAAHFLPHCKGLRRVSIVPRGMTGGFTMVTPEHENSLRTRAELEEQLVMIMAGYAAEVSKYGESGLSTGCTNDLERADSLVRYMVTRWGMVPEVGFFTPAQGVSEERRERVDEAVKDLLTQARNRAAELLATHSALWMRLAHELMNKETLNEAELTVLLG